MGGLFVKIIASLGPSSTDEELVLRMAESGADAFRTNFAHGDPEVWLRRVRAVRAAEEKLGRPFAMIGDLKGPSVRVGELAEPLALRAGEKVIVTQAATSERAIPIPLPSLYEAAEPGDELLIDDGRGRLRVVDKRGDSLECISLSDFLVNSNKNASLRGKDLDVPLLSERDMKALKLAAAEGFDFIGLSHVRTAANVEEVRRTLRELGSDAWVISKIETIGAVQNIDEIIEVSDVVLVARGDLGIRLNLEEVPYYQKLVVEKCLSAGKPVIVATELLASMVERSAPTRAEVVDVSVAVAQGVDALALTNETSVGRHPLEAVKWLKRIIDFAESKALGDEAGGISSRARRRVKLADERFALGVTELAESMRARLVLYSLKGRMAKLVASLRPSVPALVGTPDVKVARKLALLWGLYPLMVEALSYEEGLAETVGRCLERGLLREGETGVLGYGLREAEQKLIVKRIGASP